MTVNDEEFFMRLNGILNDPGDTVVTVTEDIKPGETVYYLSGREALSVKALSHIPIYHKVAVASVSRGLEVRKYGEKIGVALCDFKAGEHVHEHNLGSRLED